MDPNGLHHEEGECAGNPPQLIVDSRASDATCGGETTVYTLDSARLRIIAGYSLRAWLLK